jgi:hypothetical protein
MVKRLMLLVMMVAPVAAVAQETSTAAAPEGIVVPAPAEVPIVPLFAPPLAQLQKPAPAFDAGGRRRPSMVGYVNDSTIRSQFRIRFDAGYDITSPDRAEFFYAKCGCYRGLPADADIFDADAPGPAPGILSSGNFQQLYLLGEVGLMENRASLFAELPVRWLKPQAFIPDTGSFDDRARSGRPSDRRCGKGAGYQPREHRAGPPDRTTRRRQGGCRSAVRRHLPDWRIGGHTD